MKPDRNPRRAESGHTLVELLVAVAVTLVLSGLMIGLVANTLGHWQRAGGELAATIEAERALDFLEGDLRAAVLRRDGCVWFAATVQPDQTGAGDPGGSLANWSAPGGVKPGWGSPGSADSSLALQPASGRIDDCRFGMAGMWLRFVTAVPDDNSALASTSAPRVVGYQLLRHAIAGTAGATVRYSLFRAEVRPQGTPSTFSVGGDVFAAEYNQPSVGGTNLGDPGTVRRPRRDQLLANNVVDFGVRLWGRDAAGRSVLLYPVNGNNLGFAATVRDGTAELAAAWSPNPALPPAAASAHGYVAAEMAYGFPAAAELLVRVLTEEGARRIEALEAGQGDGGTWWTVAVAHSRVYTRWVEIGSWAR